MESKIKNNKVSVYLVKPEYHSNFIKEEYKNNVSLNALYSSNICKTYVSKSKVKQPIWISSFYGASSAEVLTAYPKAVSIYTLNIEGDEVMFAVPFGGGKSMMINNSLVEDFGLKVLLNSVDTNQFRQVQMSDCGKNFRSTSSQLPKLGTIEDFSFDFNTDLLSKAVAKCDDSLFANNNIIGGEGITITGPYKCDNIEELLVECYKRYKSTKYKENFSWLDNIKEVKDSILKDELEKEVVSLINNKEFDKVWMSVPEVITWDDISYFKFRKKDEKSIDVSIKEFVKTFEEEEIKDFNQIKSRNLLAYDINDIETHNWSANKCLMCEIKYKNNIYCYNNSKWYIVNVDFAKEIDEFYNNIKLSYLSFPDYVDSCEKEYNKKLSSYIKGSYLMDCEMITALESGRSPIELCDVLTKNNELIHVKKGSSSSDLSHLYNQARVSADLLRFEEFRKRANDKIGVEYFGKTFDPSKYTIVLGIITKYKDSLPKIPFFSKVSIKYLVQDLQKMGYHIMLKNIYINAK